MHPTPRELKAYEHPPGPRHAQNWLIPCSAFDVALPLQQMAPWNLAKAAEADSHAALSLPPRPLPDPFPWLPLDLPPRAPGQSCRDAASLAEPAPCMTVGIEEWPTKHRTQPTRARSREGSPPRQKKDPPLSLVAAET